MKTYITSDLHFEHANIKKFCPESRARFGNVAEMTDQMIQEWNEVVTTEDTVYILGDVAFCQAQLAVAIMQKLNGSKILIEGNHDIKLLKDNSFRKCFKEIHQYLRLNYNGQVIILSHYPFLEWDQMHRGSLHFHGHLHGNKTNQEHFRCKDVGMDSTGKIVMLIEDAIACIANNEIKSHH